MIWSDLRKCKIDDIVGYINEKVWDMFNELVEDNKPIDKHDLMSMG